MKIEQILVLGGMGILLYFLLKDNKIIPDVGGGGGGTPGLIDLPLDFFTRENIPGENPYNYLASGYTYNGNQLSINGITKMQRNTYQTALKLNPTAQKMFLSNPVIKNVLSAGGQTAPSVPLTNKSKTIIKVATSKYTSPTAQRLFLKNPRIKAILKNKK